MTPARAGTAAVAGVLGAAVLLIVLVTWAASIGPDRVLSGTGPDRAEVTVLSSESQSTDTGGDTREERATHADRAPGWVRNLAIVLEIAALGVLLFLLYRLGRRLHEAWRARTRRAHRATEEVEFAVLDPAREMVAAIEEDAAEQRALLLDGEARNAIVECWRRFEVQAGRAGAVRRAWQTPSEFVLQALDLAGADAHEVIRLADLYREARFSDHPITDVHRAEALAALDAIHRSLQSVGSR